MEEGEGCGQRSELVVFQFKGFGVVEPNCFREKPGTRVESRQTAACCIDAIATQCGTMFGVKTV